MVQPQPAAVFSCATDAYGLALLSKTMSLLPLGAFASIVALKFQFEADRTQ
jgi:hypothetical protein